MKKSALQAMFQPMFRPMFRGMTEAGVGGGGSSQLLEEALALSPLWLYDHKDIGSFFEDAAMTIPASVNGVVGAVLDKSGNGRHRTQSSEPNKPVLRQDGNLYYLEYDGASKFLQTASVNLTAIGAITACMGVRKLSDAATGLVFEFSSNLTANFGTFGMFAPPRGPSALCLRVSRRYYGIRGNCQSLRSSTHWSPNRHRRNRIRHLPSS